MVPQVFIFIVIFTHGCWDSLWDSSSSQQYLAPLSLVVYVHMWADGSAHGGTWSGQRKILVCSSIDLHNVVAVNIIGERVSY